MNIKDSTIQRIMLVALGVATLLLGYVVVGKANAEAQRDDIERRYAEVTDAPTPTVTVTRPVTLPPTTLPPRTVYVTRASRDFKRTPASPEKSARKSSALDLRHERLWQMVADCETGARQRNGLGKPGTARWGANRGLFDGGLQFLPSTWRSWGGTDFAPYAYQATREEQITIANRSTRSRVGEPWLQPWPDCGRKAARALGYKFP